MPALPTLFISHGAPTLAIVDSPARRFLAGLAAELPRPRAILVASAHFLAARPVLSAAAAPETIHDFGGFGPELEAMRYPAPGDPALAERAAGLLAAAGLPAALHPSRGLDHGAWVPLAVMYPAADIPVVSLAVQPRADAAHHWRLGAALAPLRAEGVLVVGSGAVTHNLEAFFSRRGTEPAPPWVGAFADWLAAAVTAGDAAALLDWAARAPHAAENHPTTEHLLPLFVAAGAGLGAADAAATGGGGRVLHRSTEQGVLAMDAYAFG